MKNLEELYNEVKAHVEKVDFSLLYDGFVPMKFALYNENECFYDGSYVERTDEFLGNTAISYNGETVAIWNVMEDVDSVILASKMIHEMFHGFQRENGESRFPDELDALYNYSYDACNLELKLIENRIIASLSESFDSEEYNKLLAIRKYRQTLFPYEYRYECCIEVVEGTAEYVELASLSQLSEKHYLAKLDAMRARITKPENFLPVRIISYEIGALFLLTLKKGGKEFAVDFSTVTVSEALTESVSPRKTETVGIMPPYIDAYYKRADEVIDAAIKEGEELTEGECDILAVNVYNAVYKRGYLVSRFFVMYLYGENQRIEYGDFVIQTENCRKAQKIYRVKM